MEFGLFEFSDQLNKYFRGELTKNELGMWGEKAFYDLLKGGYIENKKIVLYPFLKTVSKFHIEENDAEDIYPSTEDDLKYIQAIFDGGKSHFLFRLPFNSIQYFCECTLRFLGC